MGRHDYSDDDDDRRERKKKSKRDDDEDDDDRRERKKKSKRDDDEDDEDRKRRKKESKKKHNRSEDRKKKRTRDYDDSDSDDSSDDSRRRQKKHKKKKHKKDKKKRRDRESPKEFDPLQRNYAFADALHDLLDDHPALSSDLPVMLIRMAGGSKFDLAQMSDAGAAQGLERVFQSLQTFGVEREGTSWTWKAPSGGQGRNNELLLVKIARSLLDQIGVTMEAVDNYGKAEPQPPLHVAEEETPQQESEFTPLQKQTFSLLDRFLQKDVTLPNQLGELCSMILSGESVALDGLPDQNLREGLEQLFRGAGLNRSEMNDDDDDDDEEETEMGYGLPEANDHFARAHMESILAACKHRADTKQEEAPRRVVRGPLPQHVTADYPAHVEQEDDDDEDDGPAPAGMTKIRKGPSREAIQVMADLRKEQLEDLVSDQARATKPGEREEWMINPGEHDLLQGIKSGGMKGRNFENKKVRAQATEIPEGPVDPAMQAEVDAIIQAHRDARGPSLMDQHRDNTAAEKAAKANESNPSFGWSREKDLDAGRRVDKDALNLLMGGAGGGLKDKFQGGF